MEIEFDRPAARAVCDDDVAGIVFAGDAVSENQFARRGGLRDLHLVAVHLVCPVLCGFVHAAVQEESQASVNNNSSNIVI